MSHLALEVSQLVERIVVVAPTQSYLLALIEELCFELTTDLVSSKQIVDLENFVPSHPSVNQFSSWSTFTLAKRGSLSVQVTLIGYALENGLPSQQVFDIADGFIFFLGGEAEMSERFIKLPLSTHAKSKPNVIVMPKPAASIDQDEFRYKALGLWAERHLKRSLLTNSTEHLLEKSLEWILHP